MSAENPQNHVLPTDTAGSGIDWAAIAAEVADVAGAPAKPSVADHGTVPGQATGAPVGPGPDNVPAPVAEPEAKPEPVGFSPAQIAALIKEEREAKELKARLDRELQALAPVKDEYEKLKARIKDDGERFRMDPAGVLEDAGVPRENWFEIAEQIFFSMEPDKASPELRHRIELRAAERKSERWRKEFEAKQREERERYEKEASEAPVRDYARNLEHYAVSLTPDKAPAIHAWFEGDREALVQTMMDTARNLAQAADAKGERADLSPERVAREVESYLDAKFSKRHSAPAATPVKTQQSPAVSQSPAGITRDTPAPAPSDTDNSVEAREARAARLLDEIWARR